MTCPVIIVDDDLAIRESLSALMVAYDYEHRVFASGTDFLSWYTGKEPLCILLDKNLPQSNGLDLISKILSHAEALISIIMVTGFGDVQIAVKAMQLGAVDFIEKPIDPDRLIAAIAQAQRKAVQTKKSTLSNA